MKKKILSALQIIITVFFIYYTLSNLNLNKFSDVIININFLIIFFASIVYFISQIISSERLRHILNKNNFQISFNQNFTLYLIGLFYNFFIPGGIGGDAYKGYLLNKNLGWNLKKVLKLILLDRLIGLGVLCCILISLYALVFIKLTFLVIALSIISISIIGYYLVKLIFKNEHIFWKSFAYSTLSHMIQFVSIFMILYSLGILNNYLEIILVFILSSIFSVFSFGGVGIREYVFLSSASLLNFSPELAASIGLLFTFCAALSSLPGLKYLIKKPDFLK